MNVKNCQTGRSCQLSVVVPCFNEEKVLGELYQRVTKVCHDTVGDNYELVFVNDGSRDNTWTMIMEFAKTDPQVVGVSLSRNYGHQLALTAGLATCVGERILMLDADLQDPPELLPKMMHLLDEGADVVYGQRLARRGETWFKKQTAAGFYRLLNKLTEIRIPVDTGDFRLVTRRVLDILNEMPEQNRFVRGMISWLGFKQTALRYERHERYAGETKYPFMKMLLFAVDAITSFSTRPLRIASVLGILLGLLGTVGLFYALASWVSGRIVPGWTSTIITVLIIGSIQLIVIGILGEYLARLFAETKRRPLYIIDQIVRNTYFSGHTDLPKDEQADRSSG